MNAMNLMATLGLDTSGYESGLKGASGMAQSFASSFKKILGGVAVAGAAGATVAGAAITKIVKGAVTAYKDYEQLVGGVETLFGNGGKTLEQYAETASDSLYKMGQRGKDVQEIQQELIKAGYDIGASGADGIYGPKTKAAFDAYAKAGGQLVKDAYNNTNAASKKVQENADKAYMTAGLSANEYMETVTSFSASLIQSLGGDTQKAADLSDVAIRDMSDNANKMGTDMGSIQVAYAGFAKQNYTMLDNLKLGYGGTKTEMERLIKDANKLRKEQGLTADLTIEKYSDVITAIHTVQENMGITGTTAAEAADTIQGSLNSTKAAWKNLLVSFATGKDINKRLDSLVDSAKNVVKNVVPVVTTSLKSIGSFVSEIAPIIAQELPGIITDAVPAFLNAVGSLAGSLVTNFPAMISGLGSAVAEAITGDPNADFSTVAGAIITGIQTKAGEIGNAVKKAITGDENASWGEVGNAVILGLRESAISIGNELKAALGLGQDASFGEVAGAIILGIKNNAALISNELKTALGFEKDASWGEVANAIIGGIRQRASELSGELKKAFGFEGDASWGEVANAIGKGIRANASVLAANLRVALGITEGADWSMVGQNIRKGIEGAFTTGSEFLKGLLGVNDEKGWTDLGQAILGGINSALEGASGLVAGLLFGGDGEVVKEAQAIEGALKGIATAFLMIKITAALAKLPTFISEIGAKVATLSGSFGTLGTAIGIVAGLLVTTYNVSDGFRQAVDDTVEGVQLLWTALTDFDKFEQKWNQKQTERTEGVPEMTESQFNALQRGQAPVQRLNDFENLPGIQEIDAKLNVNEVNVDENAVDSAVEKATEDTTVKAEVDVEEAQKQIEALKEAAQTIAVGENPLEPVATEAEELKGQFEEIKALQEQATQEAASYAAETTQGAKTGIEEVKQLLKDLGVENYEEIANALEGSISNGGQEGADALLAEINAAAEAGGNSLYEYLQGALNRLVMPDLTPKPRTTNFGGQQLYLDFPGEKHASAMSRGEILHGLTPFGIDGNGTIHYGGEAGAEVVVGANSLTDMIHGAMQDALVGVLSRMDGLLAGQGMGDVKVVLDTGATVGGLVREMDKQMGGLGRWRGGGRA